MDPVAGPVPLSTMASCGLLPDPGAPWKLPAQFFQTVVSSRDNCCFQTAQEPRLSVRCLPAQSSMSSLRSLLSTLRSLYKEICSQSLAFLLPFTYLYRMKMLITEETLTWIKDRIHTCTSYNIFNKTHIVNDHIEMLTGLPKCWSQPWESDIFFVLHSNKFTKWSLKQIDHKKLDWFGRERKAVPMLIEQPARGRPSARNVPCFSCGIHITSTSEHYRCLSKCCSW